MKRYSRWNKIYSSALKAEKSFSLLERDDRILVGLSGGSDSLVLLQLLAHQKRKIGRILNLSLFPVHIPGSIGGRPLADVGRLAQFCAQQDLKLHLAPHRLSESIFQDCFRCSLARRRALFDMADALKCNKIALGHNADDLLETFFLNIFYSGRLAGMNIKQPILKQRIQIIRPLLFIWKNDIEQYCKEHFGPYLKTSCPGSYNSERSNIRKLIRRLQQKNPHIKSNILRAITNIKENYLPSL